MVGISLAIHPLFFALGLYYALTGGIFLFIICAVTAVVHEIGHSLVAQSLGYRLNKIVLMPFGAIVVGNTDGLNFIDQTKIALAGPIVNLCIALVFVASWWVVPEIYTFTDVVVSSNLSMAIVNLLPIFPLDGGRITFGILGNYYGYEKAYAISKIMGLVFSAIILTIFVISVIAKVLNLSLLFFSAFVFFSSISRERENKYVKIFSVLDKERLKSGAIIKRYAVDKDTTIKRLINLLDTRSVNEVSVYDNGKKIAEYSQSGIERLIESADIYSTIGQNLSKQSQNLSISSE